MLSNARFRGSATTVASNCVTKEPEYISAPFTYWPPATFVHAACNNFGVESGFETASKRRCGDSSREEICRSHRVFPPFCRRPRPAAQARPQLPAVAHQTDARL